MLQNAMSAWDRLGVSRATYFRWKKEGRISEKGYSKLIKKWIQWREEGLETKPWAETYKKIQVYYIQKFFAAFDRVCYETVYQFLSLIPKHQPTKRKHIHSTLSSMSKFLMQQGKLTREEYLRIKALYPKAPPNYEVKQLIIYQEHLEKLIVAAEKGHSEYQRLLNKTVLIFLSETGLRVSEACNLIESDLRFSDNPTQAYVKVRKGKGNKNRIVPFSKKAQDALLEYMTASPPRKDYIFWAFNPKHGYTRLNRNSVSRRFQNISKKTKIPFTAHSLRHYRITLWANNPRIPITVVQKWAGHSSLEVTQKYIHLRDEDALKAAFD